MGEEGVHIHRTVIHLISSGNLAKRVLFNDVFIYYRLDVVIIVYLVRSSGLLSLAQWHLHGAQADGVCQLSWEFVLKPGRCTHTQRATNWVQNVVRIVPKMSPQLYAKIVSRNVSRIDSKCLPICTPNWPPNASPISVPKVTQITQSVPKMVSIWGLNQSSK